MNHEQAWQQARDTLPLVAILRGVKPDEVVAIGQVLFDAGWRLMEVPLNSPSPFDSIARLRQAFDGRMVIGAGTVLTAANVQQLAEAGGQLVVAPNMDPAVIRAALKEGMVPLPGVQTATECFAALAAGAKALKIFPAEQVPPATIKALRAVLPASTDVMPVGGVTPDNMAAYVQAGASGFGIGGALYRPGDTAAQVQQRALAFAQAWRTATRA
ncbi:2-dehydro-3-deoxy-6-phosphogalactonate aldolase [Leeia oryzae]|uniref:2-dehydro-3-deoxy-6-phosphogalactonate aldolase n=1 Tax=Leeia oryzae TaxID=356662 RepID=UPI0003745466|nr:2-dehydro-3-deoxy-6-phosphogalactonate aldolase [Leeia oryzae]